MENEMKKDISACMAALKNRREKGCMSTIPEAVAFAAGYLESEYPEMTELLDLILMRA